MNLDLYEAVEAVVSPVYMVGGSVRDMLLGRSPVDFDFCTPHDPDSIEAMVRGAGRRPYLLGKKFGTVGFKVDGLKVEVTTFRHEAYVQGSRRPVVRFVDDITSDLSRRDFTIGAMAIGPKGQLIDPFGGRQDLEARVIRGVGNPTARFREDPLRVLRAARFNSTLGFTVEPATVAAMRKVAHRVLMVARERWVAEMDKLLVGDNVSDALRLLAETDVLRYVLPEVHLQYGYDQNSRYHDRPLLDHTIAVVAAAPMDVEVRWAALLHDVGKPYVREEKPGRSTYVKHDLLGAELVERTALYLKWGTKRREHVRDLVLHHLDESSPLRQADDGAKSGSPDKARA